MINITSFKFDRHKNVINRRGMSLLLLVLLVLIIVAFYAFQHIYNAQTRARQAHKLFFASSAMNLAETAIQLSILRVNNEMNDPKFNGDKNFWYSKFRKTVDSSNAITQDLSEMPELKSVLNQLKDRNAKINHLSVTLYAVDKFYDLSGAPESFRDIEKCGSVEYKCVAEFMATGAKIRVRQDFKVIQARNPFLNNYVLFIKDAWGEYSSDKNIGYPSAYSSAPGSHEGYNPKDHLLKINAKPDSAMPGGRVLFGGPMDSDKKIIVNLSDNDTDLMDEVWPGGKADAKIYGPNSKSSEKAGGSPKLKPGSKEFEAVFRSLFVNPSAPITSAQWDDILTNTVLVFKKKNYGFKTEYSYKKNITSDIDSKKVAANYTPPEDLNPDFSTAAGRKALGENNFDWMFNAHTYTYIKSLTALCQSVYKPAGSYKWVNSPKLNNSEIPVTNSFSMNKIHELTYTNYNHSADATNRRGIELFGAPGSRKFTLVEGNVWQRYSSIASLSMQIQIPPPNQEDININCVVPGVFYTIPQEVVKNSEALDFKSFILFLDSEYKISPKNEIFVFGANSIREVGGHTVGRPFNTVEGDAPRINYNSEIVVRPYNMGLKEAVNLPLNSPQAASTLIPPPKGYEELTPVISSKNAVIYDNEEDFFKTCVSKATVNGVTVNFMNLHGNVIIKSDLHLVGAPFVYKGCGTITVAPDTSGGAPVPRNIYIGTRILKAEPMALLTLYSSWGVIAIMSGGLEINASLVALHPFYNPDKNLLTFVSGPNISSISASGLKIKGNLCADRLNLPAFPTKTEIEYDPYFREMKTEDDFFVSLSTKFTYWVKEPL